MDITIREMQPDDARDFLKVQNAAVRKIAAKDYPKDVIEAWAPRLTAKRVAGFLENPDNDLRLVAEAEGKIVGVAVLDLETMEIGGCYVAPQSTRQDVGSTMVGEMERIAWASGLTQLKLDCPLNAEAFFQVLGYLSGERGEHALDGGKAMACVKMEKRLVPR